MSEQITHLALTEDEWDDRFLPITNPRFLGDGEPSYGFDARNPIDLDYLAGVPHNRIWSHVDSEVSDRTVIINGIHQSNHIQYFVTEKPAPDAHHIVVNTD